MFQISFNLGQSMSRTLSNMGLERMLYHLPDQRPALEDLAAMSESQLPRLVQECSVTMSYIRLFGALDWKHFPERPDQRIWPDFPPIPFSAFSAACLVKIDRNLVYMSDLRQFLVEHPALLWVLGFPLFKSRRYPWGFDANASLPTERHFCRLLRQMPHPTLEYLLDSTVQHIQTELAGEVPDFGQAISLDTKHIIAWVKENNPKQYIEGKRYEKTQQPKGDPDCKLGCKRRRNQRTKKEAQASATPTANPIPAAQIPVKDADYYWGYGSGVVATKVHDWGEFVLAELTQTFDHADVNYFFPLIAQVERRLGFRPKYGAMDAAYDAFYIYDYFHQAGGFAAVPRVEKGKAPQRTFDKDGLPLCAAELSMPLKMAYLDRTTAIIEYERGQYVCPLFFPHPTNQSCPTNDEHWAKGGCATTIATSIGARIRHTLPRSSDAYKDVYRQRTATERVNSQAKEFGIERPKLRNADSIRNLNTLTYVLINLHALQRVRQRMALRNQANSPEEGVGNPA
jgi:hypothetical protein